MNVNLFIFNKLKICYFIYLVTDTCVCFVFIFITELLICELYFYNKDNIQKAIENTSFLDFQTSFKG